MAWRMDAMIRKCPCLRPEVEEVRMLDFKHCSLSDVPNEIFNFERTLEELYLDANQIHDLPRPLFHCHELRILGLSDNDVHSLPQAIASLINLEELDISKNGVLDIPDNIKGCKCLRILEASVNPLGKLPDGFTQLINLEELYLNDTFVDFLPANFGRLTKLRILELRENHLKSLPKSMARLTELTRLDIGQNDFREMPEVIGSLPKLTEFWCDCNRISSVPSFLGNLRRLTYLEVSQNRIESLPSEIENCVNLTDVTLSSNSLKTLPESIGSLVNLSTLRVDDNRLQKLPNSIGCLSNLEEFVLSQNDLKSLPSSIGLLRKMHTFIIDDNLLESLPPEMGSCASLTILSARCNRLSRIPDELGHIPQLRIVNLCDNRITFLPFSITKLRNLQALWLSENQNKPLIPLQSDIDIDTGQRVLTCFILPQVHQQPCEDHPSDTESVRQSSWDLQRPQRQHIKFAPDEKLDKPGKLIRNPTPYPKELKAHAKHARNNQAIKTKSANYANIDSLNDDESNPIKDLEMSVVHETAVWLPSMPVTVKEARVTKPKSPHLSPKLHKQLDKNCEESIYGRHQQKQLITQGRGRISSDSSSVEVSDGRERSNSVKDFPAVPAVNRAIGSPVTVGKFASLPELSAATAQLKMTTAQIKKPNSGGRGLGVKEAKHQRSYSSGILRKLENLKQGRQHKYEGLKNAACRSDQDLYLNLREANGDGSTNQEGGVVTPVTPTSLDGYSSDWEAVVARRYGNSGNSSMTFGQSKRPASISAATTRPVPGRWNTPSPPTNYRQQLVGSYSRLLCGGSPRTNRVASSGDRGAISKKEDIKGSDSHARMSNSPLPRPPPDVFPRSGGQCEPSLAGGMPSVATQGRCPPSWMGRHGVPVKPCLPPKFAQDPPSLPPRSKPLVLTESISCDAGVASPHLYSPRQPTATGTVPPSPNRNRKPPPYHIAATYSRQIGDSLLGTQSSEMIGHPYARPPSGPPSPHGSNIPVLRFNMPASTNGTYSTQLPPSNNYSTPDHPHFRRSATPPFFHGRSITPPFPPVHSATQAHFNTGDRFSAATHYTSGDYPGERFKSFPQLAVPGDVSVGSPRPQPPPVPTTNAVVNGAVVYNNPYINEQPRSSNRSPSPASHSPASSGSHRSGRSSGDRASIKLKRSSSSSSHLAGQQSPHQEHSIYARRTSPKVPPLSPAGTPQSSASSNSSCEMVRTPLRPLAPLNVSMLPRSFSAPSTPPSAGDHPCPPSPPVPPYRTPPLYHSLSIGNLDTVKTGHHHSDSGPGTPTGSYHEPCSPTREYDKMRNSSNGSPPNLLKKCRMSQEQRTSPVSSRSLYANTRNADSPMQTHVADTNSFGFSNSNIYGHAATGRANAFPFPTNGSVGASSQPILGSTGRSSAWVNFPVAESNPESKTASSVDLVDKNQYGIFTAHPVLVDSCGSRDETSASEAETKPRSSVNNWSALSRGGATVFSNPYVGGGGSGLSVCHHPPNLTQDKLSQRGGSAPLVVPTPHRPAGLFSVVTAVAKQDPNQLLPPTPPLRNEGDSPPVNLPTIQSFDKHFVDRQVVLLKKQSPWLFGQHRNPKVIPVVIQKNPDLGFSITQYQNGSSQPFESAICVASVTPEGAASTVLKPGDKLLQVDGKDISRLDLLQARRVLQDTGSTVFMMVSR